MVEPKSDKLSNFVRVHHDGMNEDYRLHKDDVGKLGTPQKVAVFANSNTAYFPPNGEFPNGRYTAKTRVFVASYLKPVPS